MLVAEYPALWYANLWTQMTPLTLLVSNKMRRIFQRVEPLATLLHTMSRRSTIGDITMVNGAAVTKLNPHVLDKDLFWNIVYFCYQLIHLCIWSRSLICCAICCLAAYIFNSISKSLLWQFCNHMFLEKICFWEWVQWKYLQEWNIMVESNLLECFKS